MDQLPLPRPRFVPDAAWPPYAFVPDRGQPHPVREPEGHLYGAVANVERMHPDHWQACRTYLWGIDLFNFGFYWEAHETWEGVWRGHARAEITAVFLQGLIKFAAAGVKVRQGIPAGVVSLANGAAEHFAEVLARIVGQARYCGLNVQPLGKAASRVAATARDLSEDSELGPRIAIAYILRPGEDKL